MMDMSWVTGRIAVGGGIWTEENMAQVVRAGVTHIIDMQIEFDDTSLALPYGIRVLWNPIDDDFQPKSPTCSSAVCILRWRLWTRREPNFSSTAPQECTGHR